MKAWRRLRLTLPRTAAAALLVAVAVLVDAVPHPERRQRQHLRRPQERREPQQDLNRSPLLALRRRLHGEQERDSSNEIFHVTETRSEHF